MTGFTDLAFDLYNVADDGDDPLLLAFLTMVVDLLLDVFEVLLGADTCVGVVDDDDDNKVDDVQ